MARIPRPRGPRTNRNRIYTIMSLVIVVVIIAYIYIPFGHDESDPNSAGLITNSNSATVHSDFPAASQPDSSRGSETGDVSLQSTSPDWSSSSSGETPTGPQGQAVSQNGTGQQTTPQPDRIERKDNPVQPTGVGEITTTMRQPASQNSSEADKLIAEATALLNQSTNNILPARDKLNQALRSKTISAQQVKFVKTKMSDLADDWLFNRVALPGDTLCEHYKVQSGDQLRIIGDKRKVPYEILMEVNKIRDAAKLQAGQTIKVINGPFHAKVYRSTFTMDVYLKNTYVRTFKVGLGVAGSETPTGLWRVAPGGKLIEPEWTDPNGHTYYPTDPDYPLGSRWIGLEGLEGNAKGRTGFAIHGTHKPETLGTASSQGCIRLENGNAILVYNMLIPTYSTVEVLD
jgi:lipoprotein-anchoring transpeptidase ErfK/SrfK